MLTLTKGELVDELSDVLSDTCDMDVPWSSYAEAVVKRLELLGVAFAREAGAPCSACGKPAETASCGKGGCPLGADL